MLIFNRKHYPNRVSNQDAPLFPFGQAVEDTVEFQSFESAVSFMDNLFKNDPEAVYLVTNHRKQLDLRDRGRRIFYQLKSA